MRKLSTILNSMVKPELHAPPPFRVTDGEPWPRVYRPKVEQASNANHMLRRHLRSRAFWKHHGDWERELEAIRGGGEGLLEDIAAIYLAGLMEDNKEIRPTRLFGRTALEDAFQEHDNMKVEGHPEDMGWGGVGGVGAWAYGASRFVTKLCCERGLRVSDGSSLPRVEVQARLRNS